MNHYFEAYQSLRDRAAAVASSLSVPTARALFAVNRGAHGGRDSIVEILPRPITSIANESTISRFQGMAAAQIQVDDYQVRGISSDYSYEFLLNVTTWVLDATLSQFGDLEGGVEYVRVAISAAQDGIQHDMVIRRKGRK